MPETPDSHGQILTAMEAAKKAIELNLATIEATRELAGKLLEAAKNLGKP